MAKSIIQDERICYLTGRGDNLERHHVFYGMANRRLSEKYGLWVYLTRDMHTGTKGVHMNRDIDMKLQADIQQKAMDHYGWDVDDFRRIFGKNYIL